MCRNCYLTKFGPLCCVHAETAEDINCPNQRRIPWFSVLESLEKKEEREEGQDKNSRFCSATLLFSNVASGSGCSVKEKTNTPHSSLDTQVSAHWTWRIEIYTLKYTMWQNKITKDKKSSLCNGSVNFDCSIDFPDEHVGSVEANCAR